MRILTFTSLFPDSSRPNFGVFVYQRMAHVSRLPGNTITVVAPVPYMPSWVPGEKARKYRAVPANQRFGELLVYHPRYPLIPKVGLTLHGLLMFLGAYSTVRRLVAQQHFDCIDAHFVYPDGFAAVLLGRAFGIPVIASARGTDINLYPTIRHIRPLLKWTVQHADGLIGVCSALSQEMIALGARPERVRTIGNGVDPSRFSPANQTEVRILLKIPDGRKIILAVGSLVTVKGYHLLIPAIADLKRRGIPVRLYIAGEGPARPQLERMLHHLDLSDDVILLGNVPNDQLRSWYSAADVSCLSSSREGWANVLLESMACGTPVVASRIWGTPEVVVSDDLGLLVDLNSQAIADGLSAALQRSWNREQIALFARQRSWDTVGSEVQQWLEEVSNHKSRGATRT
jgi:teichuronic acid biosynthesis glycosyltransferase TuaC